MTVKIGMNADDDKSRHDDIKIPIAIELEK